MTVKADGRRFRRGSFLNRISILVGAIEVHRRRIQEHVVKKNRTGTDPRYLVLQQPQSRYRVVARLRAESHRPGADLVQESAYLAGAHEVRVQLIIIAKRRLRKAQKPIFAPQV